MNVPRNGVVVLPPAIKLLPSDHISNNPTMKDKNNSNNLSIGATTDKPIINRPIIPTGPPKSSRITKDNVTTISYPLSIDELSEVFIRPFTSLTLKDFSSRLPKNPEYDRKPYLDAILDRYRELIIQGNDLTLLEESTYYSELMKQRFFDPNVLKRIEQALYEFTNDYNDHDKEGLDSFDVTTGIPTSEMIHYFFNFNRQIGSDSVNGLAHTFGPNFNDCIVVKHSVNEGERDEIYHEWAIGRMLNKLRMRIPNFVYTLGCLVGCSVPISQSRRLSPDGKIASWCSISDKNGSSPYLLLERIYEPTPLFDYIYRYGNVPMLINFILQISLSLAMANQQFKFTHYDLHVFNILCWSIPNLRQNETVVIPYSFMGRTLYVRTSKIASIIDLGYSRGEHEGHKYHNNTPRFRIYDRFYGLTDIFRLTMSLYSSFKSSGQQDLLECLRRMLYFFTDEDIDKVESICNELKIFNLPANSDIERLDCSFFVAYLLQTFNMDFISWEQPTGARVLGCGGTDYCVMPGQSPIKGKIIDQTNSIDPVILYYLYANKGITTLKPDVVKTAIVNGNNTLKDGMDKVDQDILIFITKYQLDQSLLSIILSNQTQMEHLYFLITTLLSIYDRYQNMLTIIRSVYYLCALYFPTDERIFYNFLSEFNNKYSIFFQEWFNLIRTILTNLSKQYNQVGNNKIHKDVVEVINWISRYYRAIMSICNQPQRLVIPYIRG